jgi:hypothetical protein
LSHMSAPQSRNTWSGMRKYMSMVYLFPQESKSLQHYVRLLTMVPMKASILWPFLVIIDNFYVGTVYFPKTCACWLESIQCIACDDSGVEGLNISSFYIIFSVRQHCFIFFTRCLLAFLSFFWQGYAM